MVKRDSVGGFSAQPRQRTRRVPGGGGGRGGGGGPSKRRPYRPYRHDGRRWRREDAKREGDVHLEGNRLRGRGRGGDRGAGIGGGLRARADQDRGRGLAI